MFCKLVPFAIKKERALLIAVGLLFGCQAYGQQISLNALDSARLKNGVQSTPKLDIRVTIIKTLTKHIMNNNDQFWKKPVNVPYLFAIAFSFNNSGVVEDVFFSKSLSVAQLEKLRIDSTLVTKLKSLDLHTFKHRDEVVMFPILFLDYHAKEITLENGFISDYINLWPQMDAIANKKKLTLLAPYYNRYGTEIY